MFKKVLRKSQIEISAEWDLISSKRQTAIEQGKDVSLISVTSPCILKYIASESPRNVLDVGCGSGYLTSQIARIADKCIGIDMSQESIRLANKNYSCKNLEFVHCTANEFVSSVEFQICVSNMAFMSDTGWLQSIKNIFKLLPSGGTLLTMITHPCLWPKYWGLENNSWFNYADEIYIEGDFSISLVKSIGKITYIHRPLQQYIDGLISTGFTIEGLEEPYPIAPSPNGYTYSYPRFLFIKCRKL